MKKYLSNLWTLNCGEFMKLRENNHVNDMYLNALNDSEIRKQTNFLVINLTKKAQKGVFLDLDFLANSCVLKGITTKVVKITKDYYFATTQERKDFRRVLALSLLSDTCENLD